MNDIPVLREVTRNMGYYVDFYGDDQNVVDRIYDVLNDDNIVTNRLKKFASSYTVETFVSRIYESAERIDN